MSSADLRYPRPTILADYARAGAGVLLCGAPLLLLEVNHWLALVLGAGFALFALFLVRTALRHRTRYVLTQDTLCADGPAGTLVEWNRLDRMKLSYFSTKRDRSDGWMQLSIGSTGGRLVKVDSSLDGFHDIVERAALAAGGAAGAATGGAAGRAASGAAGGTAEGAGVVLSDATRANLRAMGIVVAGQEETV